MGTRQECNESCRAAIFGRACSHPAVWTPRTAHGSRNGGQRVARGGEIVAEQVRLKPALACQQVPPRERSTGHQQQRRDWRADFADSKAHGDQRFVGVAHCRTAIETLYDVSFRSVLNSDHA
jgi:hypothetical protein